ncbi:MAG: YtxH domain-containing protein [Sporolactobacillus sp.]|uniref:YtxH domain-containing protein n=1 Tax=Sporolactobacillus sp. STSJ-5 TaxID=2965076 RepID=UPI002104105B|nr:YtxH domain-containing protein [Sporolactobacillus sp. STSJ-5]MCQ2008802.1 YtxH domain-containing protein [Sporolactobacillus sp. STSJ-5]
MASENEKCTCSGTGIKELVLGGIIGGAIGASIALLFAPKSGAEMRKDLSVREIVDSGVDKVKQATTSLLHKDDEPFS